VPMAASAEGWSRLAADGAAETRQASYPGARHEILNETNREQVVGDVLSFVHEHLRR